MFVPCTDCGGSGYTIVDCPYCRNTDSFEFDHLPALPCKCCGGTGIFEDLCPTCGGKGKIEKPDSA